jgi:hypothetical protein
MLRILAILATSSTMAVSNAQQSINAPSANLLNSTFKTTSAAVAGYSIVSVMNARPTGSA